MKVGVKPPTPSAPGSPYGNVQGSYLPQQRGRTPAVQQPYFNSTASGTFHAPSAQRPALSNEATHNRVNNWDKRSAQLSTPQPAPASVQARRTPLRSTNSGSIPTARPPVPPAAGNSVQQPRSSQQPRPALAYQVKFTSSPNAINGSGYAAPRPHNSMAQPIQTSKDTQYTTGQPFHHLRTVAAHQTGSAPSKAANRPHNDAPSSTNAPSNAVKPGQTARAGPQASPGHIPGTSGKLSPFTHERQPQSTQASGLSAAQGSTARGFDATAPKPKPPAAQASGPKSGSVPVPGYQLSSAYAQYQPKQASPLNPKVRAKPKTPETNRHYVAPTAKTEPVHASSTRKSTPQSAASTSYTAPPPSTQYTAPPPRSRSKNRTKSPRQEKTRKRASNAHPVTHGHEKPSSHRTSKRRLEGQGAHEASSDGRAPAQGYERQPQHQRQEYPIAGECDHPHTDYTVPAQQARYESSGKTQSPFTHLQQHAPEPEYTPPSRQSRYESSAKPQSLFTHLQHAPEPEYAQQPANHYTQPQPQQVQYGSYANGDGGYHSTPSQHRRSRHPASEYPDQDGHGSHQPQARETTINYQPSYTFAPAPTYAPTHNDTQDYHPDYSDASQFAPQDTYNPNDSRDLGDHRVYQPQTTDSRAFEPHTHDARNYQPQQTYAPEDHQRATDARRVEPHYGRSSKQKKKRSIAQQEEAQTQPEAAESQQVDPESELDDEEALVDYRSGDSSGEEVDEGEEEPDDYENDPEYDEE